MSEILRNVLNRTGSQAVLALAVLLASRDPVRAQARAAEELTQQAVRALNEGQTADAIRDLERAHALAADDARITFNLGLAYVKAGRFAEAVEPLEHAMEDPASRDKARFLLGTCEFELGRYKLAAARLEPLRLHPDYGERTLYLLEESYRKLRNGPGAELAFSELLKHYPDSALVHKLLGTAYDADGRFREALAEFQKAAERDPSLPEVKFDAGLLCLKLHDEPGARKWMTGELAGDPCSAAALYYLGEMDQRAGHLESAEGFYRRAIRCSPRYAEPYLALGATLQGQGKDAGAEPLFRQAIELQPDRADAHFQLARSLAKMGRADESRRELERAKELAAAKDAKDITGIRDKAGDAQRSIPR